MSSIKNLVELQFSSQPIGTASFICPECSSERAMSNRNSKCLRVTFENESAVWFCHNCEEKGQINMSMQDVEARPERVISRLIRIGYLPK